MIVISSELTLAPAPTDEPLNTPLFGWRNIVTPLTVAATSEDLSFPIANVANPATSLRWLAGGPSSPPVDEYITVTVGTIDPIDYLGVAVHNFGSSQIPISVEGASALVGSPPALDWFELAPARILPNNDPVVFRWAPQPLLAVRLRMQPGAARPTAAVLYVGKLLVMERGINGSHVPINFGREVTGLGEFSESGHYLGRILLRERRKSSLPFSAITSDFYRSQVDPFIKASKTTPFFVAWKPQQFPNDVGFCAMTNDPQPTADFATGRFSLDMQVAGVAVPL
jgi:hypothetical protein